MPRRFWNAAIIILFSVSLFRLTAWAEDSATIRVTASVVPAIGFDRSSCYSSDSPESGEGVPLIRYAENTGVICNIIVGKESQFSFAPGNISELGQTSQIKYYPVSPLVSLCDISPQIKMLASPADTCLITIIYSEN